MSNYLKAWGFTRVLRLAIGIFVVVQGIQTEQWTFILLGSLFSIMPLLNIGCCGTSGCSIPAKTQKKNMIDDIIYEEVR